MKAGKTGLLLLLVSLFFAGVAWYSYAPMEASANHAPMEASANIAHVPTEAWEQVATAGIGDAGNTIVVAMQEYGNNLYGGTFNGGGASVLRSPDGETWVEVETGGFGDPANTAIYSFAEYDGRFYAATGDNAAQAELWASQTGDNGTWQEVENTGLGASQGAYWSLLVYQDLLWVGTAASGGASAELFTYDSNTTNWTPQTIPGFTTSGTNTAILSMVEFGGELYLGTSNTLDGAQVWRYDGVSSWERVAQHGFGNSSNVTIYTMRVYNDVLYVGTVNGIDGAELYSTQDGRSWQLVFDEGFNNPLNQAIWNLYEANGYLYLATQNTVDGGYLYRTTDGHSWTPINLGGFGDTANTLIWGMSLFDSPTGLHLYAGTSNGGGAEIWRTVLPQPEESWEQVESEGFDGDPANDGILDYVEFEGALYAALANGNGTQVWRSTDGRHWTQVGTDGFGDASNDGGYSLTIHDGELYVGTRNVVTGAVVYRLHDNGAEWEAVSLPGFGDMNNRAVYALASFNGSLYAGTWNFTDRAEVRRYTGTGTNWVNVSPPDADFEDDNDWIRSMTVYNGYLYIGTFSTLGGEIWRTNDGGTTWESVQSDGQGDSDNDQLLVMHAFDGFLYAGYSNVNGGEVWRSADGQTGWTQVNQGGFGDNAVDDPNNSRIIAMADWNGYLYVGTENTSTGGEVWRTSVGATQADWEQVNTDGFSLEENRGVWALEVFEDQLYAGTLNLGGAEVWRTGRPDQGPNDPCCQVVKVGLELQAAGWIRVNGSDTPPIRAPHAGIYDVSLPGAGTYNITVEYVEGNQAVVQPITALVENDGSVQLTHEPVIPLANRTPEEAWSQVAGPVEIGGDNTSIIAMQQFGIYLYASTFNLTTGANIARSPDGVTWNAVVPDGFGNVSNIGIYDMAEYDGQLYAGTVQAGGTAAEMYRSTTGNSGTWQEVPSPLDAQQTGYLSLLVYDDPIVGREILWAGTNSNGADSAELWYYDSTTTNWTEEMIPGFDVDRNGNFIADNRGIYAIKAFEGNLYIGTSNEEGAEVWRRSGTDGSWSKIVQNGFGDPLNSTIYGSIVYNNVLYMGTINGGGAELYATRDGESWELIFDEGFDATTNTVIWRLLEANGYLYLGTENVTGGRVYRTVDGNAWSPVSLPGFGDPANTRIWGMGTFDDTGGDTYLYAGTTNTVTPGAEIWRTIVPQPEESWQQVEQGGIDDDLGQTSILSMVEYDNAIYAGTSNGGVGGQVWRSHDGATWVQMGFDGLVEGIFDNERIDSLVVHNNELYAGVYNPTDNARVYHWDTSSGTWEQINNDGFGSADNDSALQLHSFNGDLYASTFNNTDRAEVYRYPGTGTNWVNVSPPDVDFEASNIGNRAMLTYGSHLYLGTENNTSGGEIWRYDGTTWEAITTDGFGDSNSDRVEAFAEFNGYLYAGFANPTDGGEVWRSQTGDTGTWEQVNQNGFGRNMIDDTQNDSVTALAVWQNKLYAATDNPLGGTEVWATTTGATQADWEQVNSDGFGYDENEAIRTALLGFGNHIYAGTENFLGAEIWRTGLPDISGERFAQVINVTLRTNQATTINVTGAANQSVDVPARGLYKLALPTTGLYNISADCGQTLDIALDVPLGPQLTSFSFNAIPDQQVNNAFAVTINALDENSNPIAITGNVALSDSTGTISPTVASFSNQSSSTINVTIGMTATNVIITGSLDAITGTSNMFDVTDTEPPSGYQIFLPLMMSE